METFMKQYRVYQIRNVTRAEEFTAELWAHNEEEATALAYLGGHYRLLDARALPIDETIEDTWVEEVLV
jgi:hypothetical protein